MGRAPATGTRPAVGQGWRTSQGAGILPGPKEWQQRGFKRTREFLRRTDAEATGAKRWPGRTFVERKAELRKLLRGDRGIQYVEHAEGHGDKMFAAVCDLGLEGIVSKRLDSPYRSGPSKSWIKVKNPKAPAATRAQDGTF